ncbi:MAG: hypothetical protein ABMA64_15625 [Myxococcota bacterium]
MGPTSQLCLVFGALLALVGLLGAGGVAAATMALQKSRKCARCGYGMVPLDDEELDSLLDGGQKAEVELGTVSWEGWRCANCANVDRHSTVAPQAPYRICPGCSYRTMPLSRGTCGFCGNG